MKQKVAEKEDDDVLRQINKGHKSTNQKLKKKRKAEKERKKEKSKKKKENELKKQKKKEKKDKKPKEDDSDDEVNNDDNPEAKTLKYLKRLRIFMEEEADDLFEMFELLDTDGEVDIEELENGKVKNYLKKVFKHLKLRRNPETKAYTRDPEIHTEPLKPKITELWYQGVDSSDSGSDDENKSMEEEENLKIIEQENEANLVSMEEARKALMHGLQTLPEPEKPQIEEEESVEQPNRIQGEEWRSMLDEQFGSLNEEKGYSKLGKKLGPSGEERTDRDKKIDDFMADYTSQFRRKTLLEEHQERKKAGAAGKGPQERRAFDKDLDVNMSRIDSKKVFQMLNNKDSNLGARFGNSSSGNKYL
jgi:hypothetical protein